MSEEWEEREHAARHSARRARIVDGILIALVALVALGLVVAGIYYF